MKERIGHYTIVSELGRGGMGVVYKAHEESLNRYVAIKVLGEHLTEDPSYLERFVREARSAAKLNHPNIVQIYAFGEEEGSHYFAMEFVHGASMQGMIRAEGALEPTRAARLILQAAAGLQAAHEHDVIHRDIKPANLMVTDRGLLKIADFGLALMTGGASRLTATGMFMGTPGYLSPEQCRDQGIDQRTDIYSLGVTLYEALSGSMPFKATSPLALLRQILEVEPPDIRELKPEIDDDLRGILRKMMAKDKEQRYPDCGQLIEDLQGYLEKKGVRSTDPASLAAAAMAPVAAKAAAAASDHDGPTVLVPADADQTAGMPSTGQEATGPKTPPPMPAPAAAGAANAPTAVVPGPSPAAAPPPPSPPPAAPTPAPAAPTPPVAAPVSGPNLEPMPSAARSSGGRTGLLVAAVALVAVVALAVGGFVIFKSGILGGGSSEVADAFVSSPGSAERVGEGSSETSAPAPDGGSTSLDAGDAGAAEPGVLEAGGVAGSTDAEAGSTTAGRSGGGGASESVAVAPSSDQTSTSSSRTTSSQPSSSAARQQVAAPASQPSSSARREPASGAAAAPPKAVAQATATVVLPVGDALLAEAAASYLEQGLAGNGVELLDRSAVAGSTDVAEAARGLQGQARWLVLVEGAYLDSRDIQYMGRYDRVHQGRLSVRLVDVASGRAQGPLYNDTVEYTAMSVDDVVSKALRTARRELAAKVGS